MYINQRDPSEEETSKYKAHIISRDKAYLSRQLDVVDDPKTVVSSDLQQMYHSLS